MAISIKDLLIDDTQVEFNKPYNYYPVEYSNRFQANSHDQCKMLWCNFQKLTYAQMVAIAINSSELKAARLCEIYDFIETHFHLLISQDEEGWKVTQQH